VKNLLYLINLNQEMENVKINIHVSKVLDGPENDGLEFFLCSSHGDIIFCLCKLSARSTHVHFEDGMIAVFVSNICILWMLSSSILFF